MPEISASQTPKGRKWQRYTFKDRVLRLAIWAIIIAAIVQSARNIEVIPEFLYDAPAQMADMLKRMWPADWQFFVDTVYKALIETINIASVGTLLALVLAIPLGLMVASNLTQNKALNLFARIILVASRSVNSLVWALLFIAIFGPGPLAGTIAIAFRSVGFVGKLIGEALEQTPRGPIEALESTGASLGSRIWYGYWPQIKPSFFSIALFRWDINIRESAVLGLVGAGGIGMAFDTALNLFNWGQVSTVLLSIFTVVVIIEITVTQIRKRVL
jgi:phosphonate transport system permease protein